MRIAIVGQQAFGGAVVDAFLAKGYEVAAVFAPPAAAGGRPDPLREAAEKHGLTLHGFPQYTAEAAHAALREAAVELTVMAYVTAFVPQSFCRIPKHGTIQFHPSLLPEYRGPSALNWAIIQGRKKTGISIFRPVDGLDEGPVVLQKTAEIGPDDTVGSLYFDKIFPQGVAAMVEAAELVVAGRASETVQDEEGATYEGWVKEAESRINWANHVDQIYDLIRGCNPAPGAWTVMEGQRLQIFDARKIRARTFGAVRGKQIGAIAAVTPQSFTVAAQGGLIEVLRCRLGEGKKIAGGEASLKPGTKLGSAP
jgi:methionyl-tRNA formyltransferase